MTSDIITFAEPDDEENQKAIASYVDMLQTVMFNIHLVKSGMCNVYLKDMVQPEYEQYKRLLWSLKQMAEQEKKV
jgi:hypothetical protein